MPTPNAHPTRPAAPARTPVIASFPSCRVEQLRALFDCLTLEATPGLQSPRFIIGSTREPRTLEHDLRSAANARVILLARDPRRVVVDNYLISRATEPHAPPSTLASTLDDFLCTPPGEPTPESRLGLRACLGFMSAIARASQTFSALLIIDADDLSADPWGTMRQIADFLALPITDAQWARAAQRAGPLTRPSSEAHTHPTTPTFTSDLTPAAPDPFAPHAAPANASHSAARTALELSAGQLVFANHTITEHLHPMLSRYRKDKQTKPHTVPNPVPSRSKAA